MHNDSVQSMEYTITNPLMSAVIVASISPNIPTGMVQWVAVSLLASHLLCTPILYLSHFVAKHSYDQVEKGVYFTPIKYTIALLLASCILLQVTAIVIKLSFITGSWDFYSVHDILPASVWLLFVMQLLLIFTVACVAVPSMAGYGETTNMVRYIGRYSSVMYTWINAGMKLIIGCMLAAAAAEKRFPVFSCDVWEGQFASPNPIRI